MKRKKIKAIKSCHIKAKKWIKWKKRLSQGHQEERYILLFIFLVVVVVGGCGIVDNYQNSP